MSARLVGLGVANPPLSISQGEARELLEQEFGPRLTSRSRALLRRLFAHPGIGKRHFAVSRADELWQETADDRIERFTSQAVALAAAASRQALARAGLSASRLRGVVVGTCTGYLCPGLSSYLMDTLGVPSEARLYDLVGGGCGAALPNLALAEGLLREPEDAVLCVAVEVCSATFQMGDDPSLLVSNCLFGDGAAAAVLRPEGDGPELVDHVCVHRPELREALRYVYRDGQLHNQLSPELPRLLGEPVRQAMDRVLARSGLPPEQVAHWGVHPGGPKILTAVGAALDLGEEQLAPSRAVLEAYGNMSSPSVLFVLDRILQNGARPGDHALLLAFGAGLSVHALLLRI